MASISKFRDGYRAQVCVKGFRDTKTFRTKREANAWAMFREEELRGDNARPAGDKFTLLDAIRKYAAEVSPTKKGVRWETVRLTMFERTMPVHLKMSEVSTPALAQWRDARAKEVQAGTVIRELGLLSAVLETARREWQWIRTNPLADVKRPKAPPHRDRLITLSEIRQMLRAMKYSRKPVRSVTGAVAIAFLFALRTGVRAKEICELPWALVFDNYCTVDGKTGIRDVPLTRQAKRLIEQCKGWNEEFVIGLNPSTLDALFRKYRDKAGLEGFTYHDTRHSAATRIVKSGTVDVLSLCKIFGWKNPAQAMTYFNPSGNDLAKMLSPRPLLRLVSDHRRSA